MVNYGKFVLAFIFVIGLIGLMALVMRRLGLGMPQAQFRRGQDRRLKLIEVLALDGKRRLALVRRDDKEHLLILGASSETVVETGITPPPDLVADFTDTLESADATAETAQGGARQGSEP
ncbi:FliO/MopB family protein [Pseudomonadota bacterium]